MRISELGSPVSDRDCGLRGAALVAAFVSRGVSGVDGAAETSSAIVLTKLDGSANRVMNDAGMQLIEPSE